MPLNIIGSMIIDGPDVVPGWQHIAKYAPPLAVLGSLKYYFRGRSNTWERDLHGKVYIITGGTSGLGAAVVDELAGRGAQLILLVRNTDDLWTTELINDLREKHSNFLIYAEECDLSSLNSIRKFATKWLDNIPPRRVDGIVCCAAENLPIGKERENSVDGIEIQTAVNYMGHFHLLTLLSPSLRAQLADRDVRVILTTCLSQATGTVVIDDPLFQNQRYPKNSSWKVFGASKLQLGMFAREFQRRLIDAPRKDGEPCMVRVNVVNPGFMRSPGTKRVLTFGTLWGLLLYLITLPIWWIFLKSSSRGAQSVLYALMCPDFEVRAGGNFISDCEVYTPARSELEDAELQKLLYDNTEAAIAKVEKESAIRRKREEQKSNKKSSEKNKVEEVKDGEGVGISTNQTRDELPLFPGLSGLKGKLASKKDGVDIESNSKAKAKGKGKSQKKKKKT